MRVLLRRRERSGVTPAGASDSSELLVISPELALVDPELAARARALEPWPDEAPEENEPLVEDDEPAEEHHPGVVPWPLFALLAVSVALNVVGLRYLLDDGISPKSVFQSQGSTAVATGGGNVLGVQFPHGVTIPSLSRTQPTVPARTAPTRTTPTRTTPKANPLPRMSATEVQVRLLTRLGTKPQLRNRFLDASGIPLPGVSDRCTRLTARRTVLAFRCVVWRQPGSIESGTPVEVHVTGPKTLRVTAVG